MQVFPNFTCFLAPSGLRPTMRRTTVVQAILYQCLVLHPCEQCTVAAVRIAGSRSVHQCSDLFLAVRGHLTPPVDHRLGLCLSPSSVGCCFRPSGCRLIVGHMNAVQPIHLIDQAPAVSWRRLRPCPCKPHLCTGACSGRAPQPSVGAWSLQPESASRDGF